jgi:hypothetical protein
MDRQFSCHLLIVHYFGRGHVAVVPILTAIAVSESLYPEVTSLKWRFLSGVPNERFLLVGVEVNATFYGN